MAGCGKCPEDGKQMAEETVYGIGRICRCPDGHRYPHPDGPYRIDILNKFKSVIDALDMKKKEKEK